MPYSSLDCPLGGLFNRQRLAIALIFYALSFDSLLSHTPNLADAERVPEEIVEKIAESTVELSEQVSERVDNRFGIVGDEHWRYTRAENAFDEFCYRNNCRGVWEEKQPKRWVQFRTYVIRGHVTTEESRSLRERATIVHPDFEDVLTDALSSSEFPLDYCEVHMGLWRPTALDKLIEYLFGDQTSSAKGNMGVDRQKWVEHRIELILPSGGKFDAMSCRDRHDSWTEHDESVYNKQLEAEGNGDHFYVHRITFNLVAGTTKFPDWDTIRPVFHYSTPTLSASKDSDHKYIGQCDTKDCLIRKLISSELALTPLESDKLHAVAGIKVLHHDLPSEFKSVEGAITLTTNAISIKLYANYRSIKTPDEVAMDALLLMRVPPFYRDRASYPSDRDEMRRLIGTGLRDAVNKHGKEPHVALYLSVKKQTSWFATADEDYGYSHILHLFLYATEPQNHSEIHKMEGKSFMLYVH